jgi:hypothetical protein
LISGIPPATSPRSTQLHLPHLRLPHLFTHHRFLLLLLLGHVLLLLL